MIKKILNNKFLKFIFGFIKAIIWIALLIMLVVIIIQKVFDNEVDLLGYRVFTVASESMVPEYEIGDIIITKKYEVEDINVGDDVTYKAGESLGGIMITHRVQSKRSEEGIDYFITKGIANDIEDPEITYSQIYGKVIYKTVVLSYISKLMTNIVGYYIIFTLVGILVSYQIISSINDRDEDDGEE